MLALFLALLDFSVRSADSVAGPYIDSAHGQNISRYDLAAAGYATGNCAHCHEQHASLDGDEPAPVNGSPSNYQGFAGEENVCFGCHGSGSAGLATDNVELDTSKIYGHNPVNSTAKHTAHEDLEDIALDKHIECADCHNPHRVGSTVHSPGSNTITDTSSPIYQVTGVEPTFSSLIWIAPTSYGSLVTATKEYQICLKCHSKANTQVTFWGGSGSEAWTDLGLEFSPANMSGHPIVTGLDNYSNSIEVNRGTGDYKGLYNELDGSNWDQLLDEWSAAGTQTMYCSDCHGSNSTVAGPHGSAYRWMLGGSNKAWPYTTAARNGKSETETVPVTVEIFRRVKHMQSAPLGDLGTDNGLFCSNCHPPGQWSPMSNNVHSNGNHSNARCVDCHIRVPHGGKVSRLIGADNNGAYSNLPARYTGNGAGLNPSGTTLPMVRRFEKSTNWGYGVARCYSTAEVIYSNGKSCAYKHNNATFGSESW